MTYQIGHILTTLAQWRQAQRHNIETVIKIFAEKPLSDELTQILVGCSHDAHIGFDRRATANCHIFALLQHTQQACLRFHWHIADFIKKQRAAIGLFKTSA
ncbi:hypothetical protein FQZ97_1009440 [compost metagenome]